MRKNLFWILTAVLMLLTSAAMADDGLGLITPAIEPGAPEMPARQAVLKERPNAVIQYAVQERDDGRLEWDVFFTEGTMIGHCEVDAETWTVRREKLYEKPADALTADQAVEALMAAKGQLTVVELELERDDGKLCYEGEAELDGKRYEFEMTIAGKIVEWER